MNGTQITTRVTQINMLWQWLVVWSLMHMGWLNRVQFAEFVAAESDGTFVAYDRYGNAVLYVPDHLAGRPQPPVPFVHIDEKSLWALDLALMKPSCCEAPAGLSHFWGLPRRIGAVRAAHAPRPAIEDSS